MRADPRAVLAAVCLALTPPAVAQDVPDTLREGYRDWVLTCAPADGNAAGPDTSRCEIAQELRTAETGQRVLRMTLVRDGERGAAVTLVTPFGVRVADGVDIDAGAQTQADFLTCLQGGCVATGLFGDDMLEALSAGQTATITMHAADGETVAFEMSLAGFAAAWRRLGALD